MTSESPLLRVDGLSVTVPAGPTLVDDVSFTLGPDERLAIVGESGSGKSVTARALLGLDTALQVSGSVLLRDMQLVGLSESDFCRVRGRLISMVFQDPLSALHPMRSVGQHVAEPLIVQGVGRREAYKRAAAMLSSLGIPDVQKRMRAYPHEFSGGMCQRVALAMALVSEPVLLVADEPTTALDVRVQEQVLQLLGDVAKERSLAVILISHDVGVVAGFADNAAVMYSGRLVEVGNVFDVIGSPAHPYAQALSAAVPRMDTEPGSLLALAGTTPAPGNRPTGCAFHPRCPVAVDLCRESRPELRPLRGRDAYAACHRLDEGATDEDAAGVKVGVS